MKWDSVRLGDVCTKIGSGATPKGGSTVYINSGTSLIRSQNVYNLKFDYEGLTYITEDAAKKLNGVTIYENDVLLNITGDSVARTCMVPSDVIPARVNQHVAIVRPNPNILNPRFLSFYLSSPYMQSFMLGLAVGKGASRNAMTKDMIANFKVPCPPIEIQQAIVDILHPYSSLIENNQKQIKLLEEAAQRLYKEWFVDLHFPGHETMPVVDGVPEGWEKSALGSICTLKKMTVSSNQVPNGTAYIGLEHMPRWDFCLYSWGSAEDITSNKFIYDEDDIIFGKIRPYFHKVGFAINSGVVSTDSFVIKPLDALWGLLLMTVFSKAFVDYTYQTCKEGAKMPRADWNQMEKYSVLIPSDEVRRLFEDYIWSITRKVKKLALQNQILTEARDRLLPKLMSGELEV